MGKSKPNPQATDIYKRATSQYNQSLRPSELENQFGGATNQFQNYFNQAAGRNMQDYSNIMGGYQDFAKNLGGPTRFSFERVNAARPKELDEAYGVLREGLPGYREFASTGGYSPQDVQELRARGISPIRSAYSNTMMEMDRARSLGGGGGSPNYIAASSRAQRELPGQMADAMTGVNAELANSIRQGRLAGLAGISGIGSEMGGLSSAEANRLLQAALANQGADIQTQGMGEASLQNLRQNQLSALGGQAGLYGTTPGLSSMFGNQALNAWQQRMGAEQSRNQFGLGLLDAQMRSTQLGEQYKSKPWWQQALGFGGNILGTMIGAPGGRI